MSLKYKVRNWNEYTESLKQRGDIFIFLKEPQEKRKGGKGRPCKYADALIAACFQIKALYRLGYRQMEGLLQALHRRCPEEIPSVPDYTTVCRRLARLSLEVKDYRGSCAGPLVIAIDGTSIGLYTLHQWHDHPYRRSHKGADAWHKMHVVMDLNTHQTLDVQVTASKGTGEPSCAIRYLQNTTHPIDTLIADGGYNTLGVYHAAYENAYPYSPDGNAQAS